MAGEAVRTLLKHVWMALEPLGYPCALMGGAALAAWHHPRATRDVDLLIGVQSDNIDGVISQLVAVGCRPKHEPPLLTLGSLHFAQFLYTPPGEFYDAQFDLWLADTELQKSAIAREFVAISLISDRPCMCSTAMTLFSLSFSQGASSTARMQQLCYARIETRLISAI